MSNPYNNFLSTEKEFELTINPWHSFTVSVKAYRGSRNSKEAYLIKKRINYVCDKCFGLCLGYDVLFIATVMSVVI